MNDKIVRNPRNLSTEQMVFLQLWCDGQSFLLIQALQTKILTKWQVLLVSYFSATFTHTSGNPKQLSACLLELFPIGVNVAATVLAANWIRFG